MITPEAATYAEKLHQAALAGDPIDADELALLRRLFKLGPVVWQWTEAWGNAKARMIMGVQKNADGTGFLPLRPGDIPRKCNYCGTKIKHYPHSHSKAEHDRGPLF